MPYTFLGTGAMVVNKTYKNLCSHGTYILVGRQKIKKKNI